MQTALPWIISTLLAVMCGVLWFDLRSMKDAIHESNSAVAKQLNTFDKQLGRAQVTFDKHGAAIEELATKIPEEIRRDIEENRAQIVAISQIALSHRTSGGGRVKRNSNPPKRTRPAGNAVSRSGSDDVGRGAGRDTGEASVDLEITGVESWTFEDWRMQARLTDEDFTYTLTQRFDAVLVEGAKGEGRPSYVRVWELGPDGERMDPAMEVDSFEVLRRKDVPARFSAVNPKLEVALSTSWGKEGVEPRPLPEVAISVASYGETKDDLLWRLGRLGVTSDGESIGGSVCPAAYNLAKHLPVVQNVWLSPCYTYLEGHRGGVSLGGVL